MSLRSELKKVKSRIKKEQLKWFGKRDGLKLVIGASKIEYKGWILTEMEFLNILKSEDWQYSLRRNSVAAFLAEHVWEHLSAKDGLVGAKNCFEYLRSGGYIRVAVPDGLHPDPAYIEYVKPGGTGAGADDHKELYTYRTFSELFESAGFEVRLLEWFDEKGEFHFQEWDPVDGMVVRSKRFDDRNSAEKLNYTSLIIDAKKR